MNPTREELTRCCGATRWVDGMRTAAPFATLADALAASDRVWATCGAADWLEAFRHHPRIGDVASLREKFASTAAWASNEQAGTAVASDDVIAALAEGNRAYEERFGHIFIVCATGKTAPEMLALLEARLHHDGKTELAIAAAEQHKITALRLEKLFA